MRCVDKEAWQIPIHFCATLFVWLNEILRSQRMNWQTQETTEDGGHINKTSSRFCRCIDVVFILSSLMSTCELDRFVIQTPYRKVLKSCSAPFADRPRWEQTWTDAQADAHPPLASQSQTSFISSHQHPNENIQSFFFFSPTRTF